jgi:predicted outer membrane repeat protein
VAVVVLPRKSQSVAEGGAIAGNVVAINCTFSANASDAVIAYGGAIRAGSLQAVNCVFSANSSTRGKVATDGTVTGGGGAVHISSGSSSVVNSIFLKNTSGVSGGAIHSGTTSNADLLTVTDSTFLDNGVATPFNGAAIGCGGIVRIMNNIFWNTVATAGAFDQNNLIYVINKGVLRNTDAHYPTPSIVGQNVVKRGILGVTKGSGGDLSLGNPADTLPAGDPLFVSTVDPDGASPPAALPSASPAIRESPPSGIFFPRTSMTSTMMASSPSHFPRTSPASNGCKAPTSTWEPTSSEACFTARTSRSNTPPPRSWSMAR